MKPKEAYFLIFSVTYGAGFGLVNGITYMVAVKNSWAKFPDRPALITGISISGFGLGALIYTKLAQVLMNPDNL